MCIRDRHGPDRPAGPGPRGQDAAGRERRGLEADRTRSKGRAERSLRLSRSVSDPVAFSRPLFPPPARLAVLISGRGSNFEALAEACANGGIPAKIVLVVSDLSLIHI